MFHLEPLHPFEDAIVIAHVAQPAWREEKNNLWNRRNRLQLIGMIAG